MQMLKLASLWRWEDDLWRAKSFQCAGPSTEAGIEHFETTTLYTCRKCSAHILSSQGCRACCPPPREVARLSHSRWLCKDLLAVWPQVWWAMLCPTVPQAGSICMPNDMAYITCQRCKEKGTSSISQPRRSLL